MCILKIFKIFVFKYKRDVLIISQNILQGIDQNATIYTNISVVQHF